MQGRVHRGLCGSQLSPLGGSPPQPQNVASPRSFPPQIMLTFDDQFLLTVADDGCLFTWKVFDKDGRGIKREREVGFAEEVLVTKTDMEEKVRTGSSEKEYTFLSILRLEGSGQRLRSSGGLATPMPGTHYHSSLHTFLHASILLAAPRLPPPSQRLSLYTVVILCSGPVITLRLAAV